MADATTRILVPAGVLGLGFEEEALARGLNAGPDLIAIDGGSTDSGPFYLGTGTSKYSRDACKSEWRLLMRARAEAGAPLVIGSCGTCGTRGAVDWMYELTAELAAELGQSPTVARLYTDREPAAVANALKDGRVRALEPALPLDAEGIAGCANIVGLAGVEQIQAALATGADIVLAGRATDTASIAALPLMRGAHDGSAWHGAKIGECGAFCTTEPSSGAVLLEFDGTGCTVAPAAGDASCTPRSVSAHMLYENSDPFVLPEPGGSLDVRGARYSALDGGSVRIEGARWIPADRYTVKLEAARIGGYQTTMLAVIREPAYVARAGEWVGSLEKFLHGRITASTGLAGDDYTLDFRLIGVNAALGRLERAESGNGHAGNGGGPNEVGVLLIITAADQETATELSRLVNPFLLHHPLERGEPLPTFAFPYSPAHTERGALYEFCMNHTLELDDPMDGFEIRVDRI